MKMLPAVLVTLFVGAFGANVYDANFYIDEVLGRRMPDLVYRNRLDPLSVADYSTNLGSPNVLSAHMRKVNVTGLGQIRRHGDCGRPGTSGPGRVTVGCNVVLDRVAVSATSDLSYNRGPYQRIGVRANFTTNHALVEVTSIFGQPPTVNLTGLRKLQPRLEITNLKMPRYSVTEKGFTQELSRILQTQLSGPYLATLGNACRAVPFPR